jgi:hypothetical protein
MDELNQIGGDIEKHFKFFYNLLGLTRHTRNKINYIMLFVLNILLITFQELGMLDGRKYILWVFLFIVNINNMLKTTHHILYDEQPQTPPTPPNTPAEMV